MQLLTWIVTRAVWAFKIRLTERGKLPLDFAAGNELMEQMRGSDPLVTFLFGEPASLARAVDVEPGDRFVVSESHLPLKFVIAAKAQRH